LQKQELERRAKVRDQIILWTAIPTILLGGGALLYFFVMYLKGL
jgi:hypothetical protein